MIKFLWVIFLGSEFTSSVRLQRHCRGRIKHSVNPRDISGVNLEEESCQFWQPILRSAKNAPIIFVVAGGGLEPPTQG